MKLAGRAKYMTIKQNQQWRTEEMLVRSFDSPAFAKDRTTDAFWSTSENLLSAFFYEKNHEFKAFFTKYFVKNNWKSPKNPLNVDNGMLSPAPPKSKLPDATDPVRTFYNDRPAPCGWQTVGGKKNPKIYQKSLKKCSRRFSLPRGQHPWSRTCCNAARSGRDFHSKRVLQ